MATYRYPTRSFDRSTPLPRIIIVPTVGGATGFTSNLTGSLSFVGAQTKSTRSIRTATLSFVGALPRRVARVLTAALSFVGLIKKSTGKAAFSSNLVFNTGGGAVGLVDSYSESNQDTDTEFLSSIYAFGAAQSFTGTAVSLSSCQFYLKKGGSPTGNAVAKLYLTTGTFGTTSIPTGTALAVSDNFDVSTLTTSFALIPFTFSGVNQYAMTAGTKYAVSIEFTGGDLSNYIVVGTDTSGPTHSGNYAFEDTGSTWGADAATDLCFYVYGISTPSLTKRANKQLSAALSFIGSLATSLSHVGGVLYTATLTATLSFAGAFSKSTRKSLTAALSFVGILAKSMARSLTATLSFIGVFSRRTSRPLTATLSFVGESGKAIRRAITGTLSFVGAFAKSRRVSLSGTLSFVGLSARKALKVFSGTLNFVGAIRRAIATHLASALSFIGDFATFLAGGAHQYAQSLTATLSFGGTVTKRTARALAAATLSFSGATLKQAGKAFSASVSFAGVTGKAALASLSSSLSFVGVLAKRTARAFSATLSFVGDFIAGIAGHVFTVAIDATLNFAGAFSKLPNKALAAALDFSGTLAKAVAKALDSILCLCGRILTTGKLLLDAVISSSITTDAVTGVALVYDTAVKAMITFAAIIRSAITGKSRPIVKPCQCEEDNE